MASTQLPFSINEKVLQSKSFKHNSIKGERKGNKYLIQSYNSLIWEYNYDTEEVTKIVPFYNSVTTSRHIRMMPERIKKNGI